MYTEIKTIHSITRLKGYSVNGNPSFQVFFTDGTSARTNTDSSVIWSIENSDYHNVPVAVAYNGRGRIVGIKVV